MKLRILLPAKWLSLLLCASAAVTFPGKAGAAPADRFVWVFGWGLGKDSDVAEITKVLDAAGQHGLNGAMVSFGLDTLCKHDDAYFRRLSEVQSACERNHLDLIPSVFSIGYGGGLLSHDKNLAEGLPVTDAPFLVRGNEGKFEPDPTVRLANGGFEESDRNRFRGFGFTDQPGEVSFADTQVKHGGNAALRMENFTSNPHGHGRIMQEVAVTPNRCYRVSVWVKTQGLEPANAFRVQVLVGDRSLAPREFKLPSTTDWRRLTMLFNSATNRSVRLYAGVWDGRAGKFWLDDWTIEDAGPINVLRRPGTPVRVASADGATTYTEGRDFARFQDAGMNLWRGDGEPAKLQLLPGSRIQDGQRLKVSWYHSMLIHDSQVTVCMAEPAIYEIFDHEAKLLAERLHPRKVMLNMDEVRMGGTCEACRGRDLAQLIGECVSRQAKAIRRYMPEAEIYVWSDMFDPTHNAHGNYYLVSGDFTGSWKHLPKDIIIGVWGGAPREKSLRFFADQGFKTMIACYYDAPDLTQVKAWMDLARGFQGVRGFMYTPWEKRYQLLPAFGDALQSQPGN